ncbi:MAG TPA: FecR domain-containing protein [Chitinophagaceae bacterium]
MEQNRLWRLMARKLSGEATAEELAELNGLMRNYPESQYTYEVLESVWKKEMEPMREAANDFATERMPEGENAVTGETPIPEAVRLPWEEAAYTRVDKLRRVRNILAMACLAGIAGLVFYFYPHPASSPSGQLKAGRNEIVTRFGSRSKVVLPDGTQAWLNAGSKLTYPNDFTNSATREVHLCGEAFFEVVHDALHPFIIHTQYMDIRDLGTRFDVKAYAKENTTEATLITGSIEISLKNDPTHKIVLRPNEKLTFYNRGTSADKRDDHSGELKELKISKDISATNDIYKISGIAPDPTDSLVMETAWMQNKLVFRGETFADLSLQMERWYNVKIRFKEPALKDYVFTGVFANETINQALDELKMISAFQYRIINDEVEIYK